MLRGSFKLRLLEDNRQHWSRVIIFRASQLLGNLAIWISKNYTICRLLARGFSFVILFDQLGEEIPLPYFLSIALPSPFLAPLVHLFQPIKAGQLPALEKHLCYLSTRIRAAMAYFCWPFSSKNEVCAKRRHNNLPAG